MTDPCTESFRRYAGAMPRREDDDVAPRPGAPGTRTLILVGGFALAAAATLAVFLTDNPQYLRLAVVAVAWAFVLATFAAGRRSTDRVAAAAREVELRRAYERELEREVAARHEYELELENELRRETEDSMRYELDALRSDIAALSGLRDEVARVSALRGDIAALSGLRDEVARVAALRDDVASLNALRQDLGQLAELRADMGRLRAELTEQLSSEMLVERIVMRTQASRLPADQSGLDQGRALEHRWADDVPPRELTGGWPAVRLDEQRETQHFEQVRVERAGPRPPVPNRRPTPYRRAPEEERPAVESRPWDAPLPAPSWEAPPTTAWPAVLGEHARTGRGAADRRAAALELARPPRGPGAPLAARRAGDRPRGPVDDGLPDVTSAGRPSAVAAGVAGRPLPAGPADVAVRARGAAPPSPQRRGARRPGRPRRGSHHAAAGRAPCEAGGPHRRPRGLPGRGPRGPGAGPGTAHPGHPGRRDPGRERRRAGDRRPPAAPVPGRRRGRRRPGAGAPGQLRLSAPRTAGRRRAPASGR